ncbi:hypothetical protein NDU88_001365 [Pleurodeles waltl]|uniref:Uncharacterized protein n=1 Tax=Pleurodeles waltl TaxID=8319 RepID=A0AAV7VZU6_PLEWA|nr:hypothetical protein NDU88_001365 [Pleurodeles waltl]
MMHRTRSYFVQVGVAGCGLVQDEPFHTGLRTASRLRVSPATPLLYFYSSGPEATEQTKTTPHRVSARRMTNTIGTHRRGFAYLITTLWYLSPEKGLNMLGTSRDYIINNAHDPVLFRSGRRGWVRPGAGRALSYGSPSCVVPPSEPSQAPSLFL